MQALLQTLQDHDLGHLRIIAELWGFDPPTGSAMQAAEILAHLMLNPQTVSEIHAGLPPDAAQALDRLLVRGGRLPFADLARRSGLLRRIGPGKRDREKPWRSPASPLEVLWYRGLLATAFADTSTGPKEFAFIPSDLMALLPQPSIQQAAAFFPSVEPPAVQCESGTEAVDDAVTLLAELRRRPCDGHQLPAKRREGLAPFLHNPDSLDLLLVLLIDLGIVVSDPLQPDPSTVRDFLALSRSETRTHLLRAWVNSTTWNDLAHVPSLSTAGKAWPNDPLATRKAVVEFLQDAASSMWFEINPFTLAVRDRQPDFQRPGGDFDSWYLKRSDNGAFLQGFEHWDQIEGALLRFMINGPLHWLGAADLGSPAAQRDASAFRLTPLAAALTDPEFLSDIEDEVPPVEVRPDGHIVVPHQTSPAMRYQISRFSTWLPFDEAGYQFMLSPSSLQLAHDQGLQLRHIQTLLAEASQDKAPPRLLKALARWGEHGREARLDHGVVLRVDDADLLDKLFSRRATSRYLGERLGPTAVVVRPRDMTSLLAAAVRFGLLIDPLPPEGGAAS